MKHPLTEATTLPDPIPLIAAFRLIPARHVPAGEIHWCGATDLIDVCKPGRTRKPPEGTTTALLNPSDYRIVTADIAAREERKCQ